jgi:hypothetical protein
MQDRPWQIIALAFALGLLGSCAWVSQELRLRPAPHPPPISIGSERDVYVDVIDKRKTTVIGRRAIGLGGAEITVGNPLAGDVREALVRGLQQLGFTPAGAPRPGAATLRVAIQNISYVVAQEMPAVALHVRVALYASCDGSRDSYGNRYDGAYDDHLMTLASVPENQEYVGNALTDALEALLRDDALTRCLAGSGRTTIPLSPVEPGGV